MIVVTIPIEPLEERYSIDWNNWFRESFVEHRINYVTIYGDNTSGKINSGSFLDVVETNVYKTSQLIQILKFIATTPKDEKVVLFFHDLWFPGLEAIAYIRDGLGLKNLKICGCLHAGSYDQWDFLNQKGMTPWAEYMETGWFNGIVDKIFVATDFHKRLLHNERSINLGKIEVTGFPFYLKPECTPNAELNRKRMIVFPHRLDKEKQPHLFDSMQQSCSIDSEFSDVVWIKTKKIARNKSDYYMFLKSAQIALSFAQQETWGIAMQEATVCGAIPLCPDRLSYSEMYLSDFLYNDLNDLWRKIHFFMSMDPSEYQHTLKLQQQMILNAGRQAIPNIINLIRTL